MTIHIFSVSSAPLRLRVRFRPITVLQCQEALAFLYSVTTKERKRERPNTLWAADRDSRLFCTRLPFASSFLRVFVAIQYGSRVLSFSTFFSDSRRNPYTRRTTFRCNNFHRQRPRLEPSLFLKTTQRSRNNGNNSPRTADFSRRVFREQLRRNAALPLCRNRSHGGKGTEEVFANKPCAKPIRFAENLLRPPRLPTRERLPLCPTATG
jgi:hypothetical protein